MESPALYLLAFGAGVVSFLSPCVLPLLPGYLSYISGSPAAEKPMSPRPATGRILWTTALFVAGFSIVFSLFGSAFGVIGGFLKDYRDLTQIVAGIFIAGMGLFMTGLIKIPRMYRELRFSPVQRFGSIGALPLGMSFAIGWTPCIGPVLASLYMLALSSPGHGASLLFAYSLGLGVPFIVSGILFSRLAGSLDWLKRHSVAIQRMGGVVLMIVGLLMLTGRWAPLVSPLQRYFRLPI
ncbi:MAG: sulfite exporter TauE/SafE family protein [Chloroflexi bacterium]|nr:sulfite exporter TauE/SafE family protein [Chloroflexota bacterium]